MKRIGSLPLVAMLCVAAASETARAGLIVQIDPVSTTPTAGVAIDVYVSSDVLGGESLNYFQLQLQITVVSGTGRLEFAQPTQADFDALAADPNYVLNGVGGSPNGSVATTVLPSDTFNVGDFSSNGSNALVPFVGDGRALLARLLVAPASGTLAPSVGSTFFVALTPLRGLGTFGSVTYFYTAGDDEDVAVGYDSSPGSIAIIPPAVAVPEPSGALLALAAVSLAVVRRSRAAK